MGADDAAIIRRFRAEKPKAGYFLIEGIKVNRALFNRWVGWSRAARERGEDMSTPMRWSIVLDEFAERIGWDIETERETRDAARRAAHDKTDIEDVLL